MISLLSKKSYLETAYLCNSKMKFDTFFYEVMIQETQVYSTEAQRSSYIVQWQRCLLTLDTDVKVVGLEKVWRRWGIPLDNRSHKLRLLNVIQSQQRKGEIM